MRRLTFRFRTIFYLSFVLATLALYLAAAFIIGHEYLTGGSSGGLLGTDTLAYLSRLKFLADYFPHYPFWDPKEGGGVSVLYGYPILTHTLLIIISRLTSLNLIETLKLIGFLCVPLFAFGVFIYAWVRLRQPVVGFLAGLFYILSPIAWIWSHEWGFYAESVASVLFPFTVLFFELFLLEALEGSWTFKARLYFAVAVLLLGSSFLAHPAIFFGVLAFMIVYGTFLALLSPNKKIKNIFRLVKYELVLILASLTLIAFWFVPFYEYSRVAGNSGGGGGVIEEEYYYNDLELKEVLSFFPVTDTTDSAYAFRNFSFPLGVSLLYLMGIVVVVFKRKRKTLALVISSGVLLLVVVTTPLIIFLAKTPFLKYFASWRILIYGDRLLVPIIAGIGAYGPAYLLLYPLKRLGRISFLNTVFALFFASGVLWFFKNKPVLPPNYIALGREVVVPARAIDMRDIWRARAADPCLVLKDDPYCANQRFNRKFNVQEFREQCEQLEQRWGKSIPLCRGEVSDESVAELMDVCKKKTDPLFDKTICKARVEPIFAQIFQISSWKKILAEFPQTQVFSNRDQQILAAIPEDEFIRYDISPLMPRFSMLGPYFKKTPQMTVYTNQNSLIRRMWGYQISNFYTDDPVYSDPLALPEIAQWFGIKYMIVHEGDPVEKLEQAGFKKLADYPVFEFEKAEPLVVVTKKPTVLVIGGEDVRAYDEVFKKANFGLLSYDEGILVWGKENVDDYTLEELKKFDVLFLYGYKYKDRIKAWKLLEQYVKEGGRLFIDTGWQFKSADWDAQDTAPFFPTTTLNWTNFGKTGDYQLEEGLIDIEGIDVSKFEPLIWNDQPWGVSSGDGLRDWAKPILTVQGHPLVAGGQYGQGRIVWSGMNTLGHIKEFDSTQPEMVFASRLMDWLLEGYSSQSYVFGQDFVVKRESPDRIEFIFNKDIPENSSLYFKEAYYPRWRAILVAEGRKSPLPILRAGPGFMFVQLPEIKAGDRVNFSIAKPWTDYGAIFISLLTVFGLLVYFFKPKIIRSKLSKLKLKNPLSWINEEEDNY